MKTQKILAIFYWEDLVHFLCIQSTSEIRTCSDFGQDTSVRLYICSDFEKCLKSEQICSDFRQFWLSEIGTECISNGTILFGFQTQYCWSYVWNPNKLFGSKNCLKSEQFVRISDSFRTDGTNETFGFQTVGTFGPNLS